MNRYYPNIEVKRGKDGTIRYSVLVRVKREGLWYDIEVVDYYFGEDRPEFFKDRLVLTKLFWLPMEKDSVGYVPPSEIQYDFHDDLLDDPKRIERIISDPAFQFSLKKHISA